MASPIEATPTLRGKEAKAFLKAIQNPKPYTLPDIDVNKMHANIKRVMERRAKK
jgi:hypothetical protein